MKTFSIIVPIYNVEKYIEKCIKSILAQTYTDFELLCIDDCGQDNSMNIVNQLAQQDNRIKVIKQEHNFGIGATKNNGISLASGKYLCIIDSDDWVEPNYLETIYNVFEKYPELNSIVFNFYEEYEKGLKEFNFSYFPYLSKKDGFDEITPEKLFKIPIFCWCKAYNLEFLKQNDIKLAEMNYEEFLLHVHTFIKSPKTFLLDKKLYHYLHRNSSWTTTKTNDALQRNLKSLEKLNLLIIDLINNEKADENYLLYCKRMLNDFKNAL